MTDSVLPTTPRGEAPAILYGQERIAIPATGLTIGRDPANDVRLVGERVSRRHARVSASETQWWLEDLGSSNGTRLNGEPLFEIARPLVSGDTIVIGGHTLRFVAAPSISTDATLGLPRPTATVSLSGRRLTIGRDAGNDLVLDDPNVSRSHAELIRDPGGQPVLRDLGSRNGTRINGELVHSAVLEVGAQVAIGPFRLVFDGRDLVGRDDRGALRLDANGLTVTVESRTILEEVDLTVLPGEFVVIIGPSGAGKSTLLRALAGVSTPSTGEILVSGEPVANRRMEIGYVPQDEIVHERLTVREALGFAARLRLPPDASSDSVGQLVERALGELELTARADVRIGALSGGQRKRVGVATELLHRPSLLFLDEPTTGLDPGLEGRLMTLLSQLAISRAVVTVTHATRSLHLCDRLIVMGEGGILCFEGAPDDALAFFGVEEYADIYSALQAQPARHWADQRDPARVGEPAPVRDSSLSGARPARAKVTAAHARVLARRYALILRRDPRNLMLMLGQAPLFGLAIAGLYKAGTMDRSRGNPGNTAQMLFFLAVIVVWMGAIVAAREIVRERGVMEAERAIGVRVTSYLAAKISVLGLLCCAQVGLLFAVTLLMRPLGEPVGVYVRLIVVALLTALAAVTMGLAISAAVRSPEQATSAIPLALVPSLLFGGAIVPVASMTAPLKAITALVFTRWSYAGMGDVIGLNGRIAAFGPSRASVFGRHFFVVGTPATVLILLGFSVIFVAAAGWLIGDHRLVRARGWRDVLGPNRGAALGARPAPGGEGTQPPTDVAVPERTR